MEEGIQQYPALKTDPVFLGNYLTAINKVKKKEAPVLVMQELKEFESKGNLTEASYIMLVQSYTRDKRKEKADNLATAIKNAFPDDVVMVNEFLPARYNLF